MPYLPRNTQRRPWLGPEKPRHWQGVKKTNFYSNAPWRRARKAKLESINYLCEVCKEKGELTEATEVHHIKPINQADPFDTVDGQYGEPLSFSNLQALCFTCHVEQTTKHATAAKNNKRKD